MRTESYQQYRIKGVHEPPDGGTHYYERIGKGNGQGEYARLKLSHPQDELTIYTRTVVVVESDWNRSSPDKACSGTGMAHPAHGECQGYATDRT